MAMFFPLLPKKPRNEAERRRSDPLKLACLTGVPCAFVAVIFTGLKVRRNFPHVSDDVFAYGAVAALVVCSVLFTWVLFAVFYAIANKRRRAGQ